jgi:hypothetical protein
MEKKSVCLNVRVKPTIKKLIQELADRDDLSKCMLIEKWAKEYSKTKQILDR